MAGAKIRNLFINPLMPLLAFLAACTEAARADAPSVQRHERRLTRRGGRAGYFTSLMLSRYIMNPLGFESAFAANPKPPMMWLMSRPFNEISYDFHSLVKSTGLMF